MTSLESAITRITKQDPLPEFALSQPPRDPAKMAEGSISLASMVGKPLADVEWLFIVATLRRCQGNRTHSAKMLGISLRTLRNRLKENLITIADGANR